MTTEQELIQSLARIEKLERVISDYVAAEEAELTDYYAALCNFKDVLVEEK